MYSPSPKTITTAVGLPVIWKGVSIIVGIAGDNLCSDLVAVIEILMP